MNEVLDRVKQALEASLSFVLNQADKDENAEEWEITQQIREAISSLSSLTSLEPVAWKITTVAPEGRKPMVFFHETERAAQFCHQQFKGSTLTPLYANPSAPTASDRIDAANQGGRGKDAERYRPELAEAIEHHNGKWPEELYSGVMFFKGARITKAEFDAAIAHKGGGK